MGWIIALIVGGVAGWLASMVMNRDASMGIFWNIVVGCIGSIIGNAIAGPLLGVGGTLTLDYVADQSGSATIAIAVGMSSPSGMRSAPIAIGVTTSVTRPRKLVVQP